MFLRAIQHRFLNYNILYCVFCQTKIYQLTEFMSTLGDRIRYVRDGILKVNQAAFADILGFSRSATISDYEKNKRSPDIATLCKIASLGSVSLDWLLTGKGPIFVSEAKPGYASEGRGPVYCQEYVTIEVYDINLSNTDEFPAGEPVDAISIPKRDYRPGLVAVKIEGDSMSPCIMDGAIVGVDTKDKHLVSGKLYAVYLKYEGVTIKRVFVYPDRILLKPDNPTFPETAIPAGTAKISDLILGRVKWVYQRY